VFPGSVLIPGEISRFPEQFWLCPETTFVRVVTPCLIYTDSGINISQTFIGNGNFAFENSAAKQAGVYYRYYKVNSIIVVIYVFKDVPFTSFVFPLLEWLSVLIATKVLECICNIHVKKDPSKP